ncbi:MAG: restriction endonuclease subunit S [Candidatus Ozemobacteraceae bacterium]
MKQISFPETWLKCRLGDVFNFGVTQKVEPSEIPNDAWLLELEDIEKDTSRIVQHLTFSQRKSKSTKNRFSNGDVLYGKLRPYLNKVVLAEKDGFCTTEIIPIKPTAFISGKYLFYWLKHPEFLEYVTAESHGLNMPRLGSEAANNAPFILSPVNEQKRIVSKLDAVLARVDACRERLARVPTILKRFRQSVLGAATSGQLTENWRKRNRQTFNWKSSTVGSILKDIRYGTSKKCFKEPKKTPVIRIPNVVNGKITLEDLKFAEFEEIEKQKLGLKAHDILMIRSNGSLGLVGRVAIITPAETDFLFAGYLIRLRVDQSIIRPQFVSIFLSCPKLRDTIEQVARSTSGVNNINTEEIKALPISFPCIEEQDEIIRRVGNLLNFADQLEARFTASRSKIECLIPAVLTKAFRGELVPQNPNDEPATVLLKRIKSNRSEISTGKKRQDGFEKKKKPAKIEVVMLNLKDISRNHLTSLLKDHGSLSPEALWTASKLEIDDFYDQLKDEEARGLLREQRGKLPTSVRLLEAVS